MNTRLFLIFLPISLLLTLSSCDKPTYSKEKVEESVLKLCKDEYGLDVDVKIIGSTLGVFVPIEGLIDPDLKLNKDAGEKIENAALSIHRVTMSTDRNLKFYTLTVRDTKNPAAEFVLTGYTYDVVRVRLLDISRGEYHKRILRDFRFNPAVIGELQIRDLFRALNERSPLLQNIMPAFYPIYMIGKKESQKIEIEKLESKEISEQEALFHVTTREYYEPFPGFEVYRAIFPSGFNNQYLILVNISAFPNPIKEIVSMYFYSGSEIRQRNLQETFDQYKDIGYIGTDGFPKRDLLPDWFLSQQMVRRIKMLFTEDKRLKNDFTIEGPYGSIDDKIFQFSFRLSPDEISKKNREMIFSEILKLAGTTLHLYEFEDFEGIELIDTTYAGQKIYLSKSELEGFRKNRIQIEDILRDVEPL